MADEDTELPPDQTLQALLNSFGGGGGALDSLDFGLGGRHYVPADRNASEYYNPDGTLRSGSNPGTMGYTPHPVEFVARDRVERVMVALGAIESGGRVVGRVDYGAIGPPTSHGTRAIGAWQVMQENIRPWTLEWARANNQSGYENVTWQQFRDNPELQRNVVAFQIEKLAKRGYNDRDIASIWFTGRPFSAEVANRSDGGTTATGYITAFESALARVQVNPNATQQYPTVTGATPPPGSPPAPGAAPGPVTAGSPDLFIFAGDSMMRNMRDQLAQEGVRFDGPNRNGLMMAVGSTGFSTWNSGTEGQSRYGIDQVTAIPAALRQATQMARDGKHVRFVINIGRNDVDASNFNADGTVNQAYAQRVTAALQPALREAAAAGVEIQWMRPLLEPGDPNGANARLTALGNFYQTISPARMIEANGMQFDRSGDSMRVHLTAAQNTTLIQQSGILAPTPAAPSTTPVASADTPQDGVVASTLTRLGNGIAQLKQWAIDQANPQTAAVADKPQTTASLAPQKSAGERPRHNLTASVTPSNAAAPGPAAHKPTTMAARTTPAPDSFVV